MSGLPICRRCCRYWHGCRRRLCSTALVTSPSQRRRSPLFAQIRRLIDSGKTWIKLVAPYDASKVGPPRYADSGALARAYIGAAPERVVWGTNWPHLGEDPKPDDAAMSDLLADWAPEAAMRDRILVKNPALLYGFPESA